MNENEADSGDLTAADIASLAKMLARKEVSPVEVTRAYLERIEWANPGLKAYISVYPEQALEAARRAEAEIMAGGKLGPLHGVPLAVKDLYAVAGMKRTRGSKVREASPLREDATSVARLRAGGAIVLGMLNLHEFAFGPTGINPHYGTARNPWLPDRVCGGSSSGSGCATAARLAAGTLGTDTGGSIRIPAALCGVVGLKPTFGLTSQSGIFPVSHELDHGGPLARTVRDAALLLQAIAGEDPADPTTHGAKTGNYTGRLGRRIKGMRVGVPREFYFDGLHPEVESAVRAAIETLASLGAEVREISLPLVDEANAAWHVLALAEAYTVHQRDVEQSWEVLGPDVRLRLLTGLDFSVADLVRARWMQAETKKKMVETMNEVDVIAVPATPIPAVGIASGTVTVGEEEVHGTQALGRLTRLAPFTGQPAISVPCGFTAGGLPVGLQLIGRWFEEPALLQMAHAFERATEWHRRRPPEESWTT